jgi:hypothetical protein
VSARLEHQAERSERDGIPAGATKREKLFLKTIEGQNIHIKNTSKINCKLLGHVTGNLW